MSRFTAEIEVQIELILRRVQFADGFTWATFSEDGRIVFMASSTNQDGDSVTISLSEVPEGPHGDYIREEYGPLFANIVTSAGDVTLAMGGEHLLDLWEEAACAAGCFTAP